jgi:hypothetical protein
VPYGDKEIRRRRRRRRRRRGGGEDVKEEEEKKKEEEEEEEETYKHRENEQGKIIYNLIQCNSFPADALRHR